MELIQIVLPVYDKAGRTLPGESFTTTLKELTQQFGGATAYTRAPAKGFWENPDGHIEKDDVIVIEVQVDELDGSWWRGYRVRLEERFRQESVLIRALPCRTL